MLAVSGLSLATPATVWAASGGAGFAPPAATPTSSSPSGKPSAAVRPGNVTVSASGNGITVSTRASALLRKPLQFLGNVGPWASGDTIEIERRGRETGYKWAPTAHGTASSDGSFSATWPVNHIGQFSIRAVIQSGSSARAAGASPAVSIVVYRPSVASWYGGSGMSGARTACGTTLRPSTLGVANTTLPCGTPVALYYRGRTIVVPVIDRGPYVAGRDWDLTKATADALHFDGVQTIGAVSLPRSG